MKAYLLSFGRCIWQLIIIAFLFTSCISYQHVTIDSNLPLNNQKGFVHETDSISLFYSFSGTNCPLTINVYNKCNKPLFVDWSKSAVIFDDQSFVLAPDEMPVSGFMEGTAVYNQHGQLLTQGDFSGVVTRNKHIGFVPPFSNIKVSPLNLVNEFLPVQPSDSPKKNVIYTKSGPIHINGYVYEAVNSPLYFKSFITYSDQPNIDNPRYLSDEFWASGIYKSNSSPGFEAPNQYHTAKVSGFGYFASVVGVLAISVGYVASIAMTNSID
jgi:hypothetical protein